MSCDYPCQVCDPEEWAEETKPPPYDFYAAYIRAWTGFDKAFHKDASVLWWVPMEGQLQELTIREEREYEDINLYPGRSITQLAANYIYLERGQGESFRIISYMTKVLDWDKGLTYISAVQSPTSPPWGWWMPTLTP